MALLTLVGAMIPVTHLVRNRHKPGALWLLGMCSVLAIYPLGTLFPGGEAGVKLRFSTLTLVAPLYLLTVIAWFRLPSRSLASKVISPFFCVYLPLACLAPWLVTDRYLRFEQLSSASGVQFFQLEPGAWVVKVVSYVCVVAAARLVLQQFYASRLSRSHLLGMAVLPVLAAVVDLLAALTSAPVVGVSAVQLVITLGLCVLAYALLSRRLLDTTFVNSGLKDEKVSGEAKEPQGSHATEAISLAVCDPLPPNDSLTGLATRPSLQAALQAASSDESNGLIVVEVDQFTAITNTHGQSAGDAVLARLAGAMRETCRERDVIVRWGGEEFVILLHNSDEQRLQMAAKRLRSHIRRLVIGLDNGVALQITANIAATLVRSGQSPESALRQVEELIENARREGRLTLRSVQPSDHRNQ